MKKVGMLLMVMLLGTTLIFTGCGGNDDEQNQSQMQNQQQSEQQNGDIAERQNDANPAGADVQNTQTESVALKGEFQGLADGHSAEIMVDGEAAMFQFYDETIAEQLEIMEIGTAIQFDVETDAETGAMTIVKLYETTE